MYSTCLFCTTSLGRNESIERFPVGRRLAFDAARGRLWVVCRRCGRWNLSPLEERWEVIEECERRFRDTRLRVSTDEIGLARVADGLELVRIGQPQRPEFAAWRYGDQFGRRRMKTIALVAGSVAVGGVLVATGSLAMLKAVVPGGGLLYQLPNWINMYRRHTKVVTHVRDESGCQREVRLRHVRLAQLVRTEQIAWGLRVEHEDGSTLLTGEPAVQAAGKLLASMNGAGAFQRTVRDAVTRLESFGGPDETFRGMATPDVGQRSARWWQPDDGARRVPSAIQRLPTVDRLALEMAANEESERRAMEGELALLDAEWRSAEEIAAIADALLLPEGVDARLAGLRDGAGDTGIARARRANDDGVP